MLGELLSHLIGVVIGALIPAYFTYKAVIAKDPEEYVRNSIIYVFQHVVSTVMSVLAGSLEGTGSRVCR